jgi:hypothetical protein
MRPASGVITSVTESVKTNTAAYRSASLTASLRPTRSRARGDPVGQDVVHRPRGPPAGEQGDLGDVRHSPLHVLEVFLVCLVVGDVHDPRGGAGAFDDLPGEIRHRHLVVRANVEDVADGAG